MALFPIDLRSHLIGHYEGDRLADLAIESELDIIHDAETPDKYSRFVVMIGAKMGRRVMARGMDVNTTSTSITGGGNFVI